MLDAAARPAPGRAARVPGAGTSARSRTPSAATTNDRSHLARCVRGVGRAPAVDRRPRHEAPVDLERITRQPVQDLVARPASPHRPSSSLIVSSSVRRVMRRPRPRPMPDFIMPPATCRPPKAGRGPAPARVARSCRGWSRADRTRRTPRPPERARRPRTLRRSARVSSTTSTRRNRRRGGQIGDGSGASHRRSSTVQETPRSPSRAAARIDMRTPLPNVTSSRSAPEP